MTEPLCPYFGNCGGCTFQDVDYESQLAMKKKWLAAVLGNDDISVFPSAPFFYRNRLDLVFHAGGLGFRTKGSWHKVIDIKRCVISAEPLNDLIKEVRLFFQEVDAFDLQKKAGTFRYAVLRTPHRNSSVSIVLNDDSPLIEEGLKKIREFAHRTRADHVLATYVSPESGASVSDRYSVLKGREMLEFEYLGKRFLSHVQGFTQVNDKVAEKLHRYCRKILESYHTTIGHLVDLFGGVGTFGIINADLFRTVLSIDNFPPAIRACHQNIRLNNVSNMQGHILDAKKLKKFSLPQPLYLILDPPRGGIHPKTLKRLKELRPELLIYVSCNLKHLTADLRELSTYQIKSAALFDMFPQTPHLESVVELVPR